MKFSIYTKLWTVPGESRIYIFCCNTCIDNS
ncbi:TRASH domain-containing protein [Bacteroides finegoldii]|nr:TRASH domain-containing protein [Bacteroides finegoldii]